MPTHGPFHQHLHDQHAIDFVGAFKNAVDARITVRPADRIFFMETVAAKNLHGFIHHVIEHFAAVNFCDRAFDRVLLENFHGVSDLVAGRRGHHGFDVSRAAIHHRFDGKNLDGHFRQFFFHHAEIADLFSKGLALFRIFRSRREHVLRAAHAGSAEREAPGMCPRPISCSKFSLGTLQFSRNTGVVELPWIPILCSSLPGLHPG